MKTWRHQNVCECPADSETMLKPLPAAIKLSGNLISKLDVVETMRIPALKEPIYISRRRDLSCVITWTQARSDVEQFMLTQPDSTDLSL